jgi:WD40 repeat protein
VLAGGTAELTQAEWTKDGKSVVTVDEIGIARVWALDRADTAQPIVQEVHSGRLPHVAISKDGRRVIVADHDKVVRMLDLSGDIKQPIRLDGNELQTFRAAFDRDGRRVVTAAYDSTVRVWDLDAIPFT